MLIIIAGQEVLLVSMGDDASSKLTECQIFYICSRIERCATGDSCAIIPMFDLLLESTTNSLDALRKPKRFHPIRT